MTIQYRYDAGNRTAVLSPSGEVTYQFDPLNQLRSVVDASGKTTTYVYDAVGNLTETTLPGSVQRLGNMIFVIGLRISNKALQLESYQVTATPSPFGKASNSRRVNW